MKSNNTLWAYLLKLQSIDKLSVNHGGFIWEAGFEWNPVISSSHKKYKNLITKLNLADDFLYFLTHISDGAKLFVDIKYGQWGYKLYSCHELIEKQEYWRKIYNSKLPQKFTVFGETYGDSKLLLFDMETASTDSKSYAILEGGIDPFEFWPIIARSFSEWIKFLITAQGDKYWEW